LFVAALLVFPTACSHIRPVSSTAPAFVENRAHQNTAIVPARVLADKLTSPAAWLVLLGLGVVSALISEWFWRFSIRRYTSAST